VGTKASLLEVGIYSGGSLGMWRNYLGEQARIVGVDIAEECLSYQTDDFQIFIGDQGDPLFWERVGGELPRLDIVIDDGGHHPEQQRITLEGILPYLSPGGVYICEDVHGDFNAFSQYVTELCHEMNATNSVPGSNLVALENRPTALQASIFSISIYAYVVVIEKNWQPMEMLRAPRMGSEWQPFLGGEPVE